VHAIVLDGRLGRCLYILVLNFVSMNVVLRLRDLGIERCLRGCLVGAEDIGAERCKPPFSRPLGWEGWFLMDRVIDALVYQDILTWEWRPD